MHRLRLWQAAATAAIPLGLFGGRSSFVECKSTGQLFPRGTKLERVHASKVVDAANEDSLSDEKHVLLYFSAQWCPPCRRFTPALKEFYEVANRKGKRIEVVFISSDETEAAARQYMTEHMGEWLMVPFDDPLRWAMKKRYGVWAGAEREVLGTEGKRTGIPTLVLVDASTGEELDFTAKEKVQEAVEMGGSIRVDACLHSFSSQAALCRKMREEASGDR